MDSKNQIAATVRAAREALGLTQGALAAAAGFASLQIVSAIETGQREVKAWELAKLARALHTSIDVLLGIDEPSSARVFWRRGSHGISPEHEARLKERAARYALLEEWCELAPAEPLPELRLDPHRASFNDAARLASAAGRTLDLGSRPATALPRVLEERFGLKLFYAPLGGDESAACVRGDFGSAVLVNSLDAPWRRNFSLAHELFHLITWQSVAPLWPAEGEPEWSERLEKLAEVFAANLLLPADEVNAQLDGRTAQGKTIDMLDVIELAREFDVSTAALTWRLVNLGRGTAEWAKALLADPDFRRRDRLTMPARWTQPESAFPERYRRLALLAFEKGSLSLSRLAEFMETSMGEMYALLEESELDEAAAPPAP